MVDTISSLASIDYRHDEWGVDVTVCGSQKGLMLPLACLSITQREGDSRVQILEAAKILLAWDDILEANKNGFWPYTPPTNLLYGLAEACDMLQRKAWQTFSHAISISPKLPGAPFAPGPGDFCENPAAYSSSLTAVLMPRATMPTNFAKSFSTTSTCRWDRTRQARRQGLPHRPPRRLQRADADGHARRRRDGLTLAGVPTSRAAWRGDGLSRRRRRNASAA